ncbi:hypothetical protein PAPHI01_2224 [Pancytospora philotis]|nr:hypothetical protein PAPHI01_2224 [Pancytospora philotis]
MACSDFAVRIKELFGDFGWEGDMVEDELLYMAQAYLVRYGCGRETVAMLARKYDTAPSIVASTLVLIHESPALCRLGSFPYDLLLASEHAALLGEMARLSESFAINLLYRIRFVKGSFTHRLELLEALVDGGTAIFGRCDVWGLERPRVGIVEPDDEAVSMLLESHGVDILGMQSLKRQWASGFGRGLPDLLAEALKTEPEPVGAAQGSYSESDFFLFSAMSQHFRSTNPFRLPCFLTDFLSFLPARLDGFGVTILETYHRALCRVFTKLLHDPAVKELFIAAVTNVTQQDRAKIQYDPAINCSDVFCYNLTALVLYLSEGMFRPDFVGRVGPSRFPTFSFFYTARLFQCSVVRMIRDIQAEKEKEKNDYLINFLGPKIQKYLGFVYEVIHANRHAVYGCLLQSADKSSLNELLDNSVELIDYSPEPAPAAALDGLLADSAWMDAVVLAEGLFVRKHNGSSYAEFLSSLFLYKNTQRSDAVRNAYLAKFASPVLTKRLIRFYTDSRDENVHQDRFFLNKIMEHAEIPIDTNSLRMANAMVSDMETCLSGSLRSILKIKAYRGRGQELEGVDAAGQDGDPNDLSDDEEAGPPPDDSMRGMLRMSDEELRAFLLRYIKRSGGDAKDVDVMMGEAKLKLLYFTQPYRYKLKVKVLVNRSRMAGKERELKSNLLALTNILKTIKAISIAARKLFLNKSVFARLCMVINGGVCDLVGPRSGAFKIENGADYDYHPKTLLSSLLVILINILGDVRALIVQSGISPEVLRTALNIGRAKFLLSEPQLARLDEIVEVLESCGPGDAPEEIPEHFLDALTYVEMEHPVRLLTSNVVIDRSTFRQLMLNDKIDPFNRLPLTEESCVPLSELEEEIRRFRGSK